MDTPRTTPPQRRPARPGALAFAVLVAVALLAACGGGDDPEVLGVTEDRDTTTTLARPLVTGTYEADGQDATVEIRLLGADDTVVRTTGGVGTFTFAFDGLEPGTYEVEVEEQGEAVEGDDGATSSAFVGRTDPFELGDDDSVEVTCRFRQGCDL